MSRLSRAEFLQLVTAGVTTPLAARQSAQRPAAAGDLRRDRAARLVAAFDAQGVHRTATPVDRASGQRLRQIAANAGADAALVPFRLERVDVRRAELTVGSAHIDGLPLFDGGFTADAAVAGRLGLPGPDADIALVTLDQAAIGSEGESLASLRRHAGLRAIVAVTAGGTPGLAPSNARAFTEPYGVPVLQVGSEHQALLRQAAADGREVSLVASVTRTPSEAFNVVATVKGRAPELPPIVVMTPRSGWWHCAAERGGGLACWAEALRTLAAAQPRRSAMFVASSGHELGHLGLDAFLRARPALITSARAWVHLGANIGAAGGRMRLQASDDEMEGAMARALDGARASVEQRVPHGTVPAGEARNIHVGGGRYVSLLGASATFHTMQDRWPAAVDIDAVARYAEAVSTLVMTLAQA
jgi:hypothetical protein